MITCGLGHRPPRSCLLTVAVICIALAVLLALVVVAVNAQTPCSGVVQPIGGAVNIRPSPNTTQAAIGGVRSGTSLPAQNATAGWHPLCSGTGYVAGSVVRYQTNTPAPTVSAASATATPQPTPTRIMTNTPIPPAERTRTAEQYGEMLCIEEPSGGSVCHLFPFGTRFQWQTIPVQP